MKIIEKKQPAVNWQEAFSLKGKGMNCRIYGDPRKDRIDIGERDFIKKRDGKFSRGKRTNGHIEIAIEPTGEIASYVRSFDPEAKEVSAAWTEAAEKTAICAYMAPDHKILVYEIMREKNDLNVSLSYTPEGTTDHVNYNNGGLFFTQDAKRWVLCGKAAINTNGFAKAEENGVTIKNASRVTLHIMLDAVEAESEAGRGAAMLELQMQMNRKLVSFESGFRKSNHKVGISGIN